MKPGLLLMCATLPLWFCLPACTTATQEQSMEVSCNDFLQNSYISKHLEVTAGNSIKLVLCSNPSTGFAWSKDASISDTTVIQQINQGYLEPLDKSAVGDPGKIGTEDGPGGISKDDAQGAMGVPGKQMWTFKALKKGISILSLEYRRSWEVGEKAVWTYELSVTVK